MLSDDWQSALSLDSTCTVLYHRCHSDDDTLVNASAAVIGCGWSFVSLTTLPLRSVLRWNQHINHA